MNNEWKQVKETKEYKAWICLDELIKININYDLKNSINKKIGFRCQFNNMPMQEKWLKIININKKYCILENNTKIEIRSDRCDYGILKNCNFSNLTEKTYKYIKNEEDKHRYIKTGEYIECVCPHCGTIKKTSYSNLKFNKFSCDGCDDGVSFPEKFIANMLNQLNIKYNKQFKFNGFNYMYDFYLTDYNIIIETHGEQHFRYTGIGRTLEKEHENDMIKYDIAVLNGFEYNKNYFWIDCSKSTTEFIKLHILESKLSNLLDLSNIDWKKCTEYASSSLQHQVWEYWKIHVNENDELLSLLDVSIVFNLKNDGKTVREYLKNGTICDKCFYDEKEQLSRSCSKGYYVVDTAYTNNPIYYKNTLQIQKEFNINRGTITRNCQYHRDNNDFKLINNRYLFFYKYDFDNKY